MTRRRTCVIGSVLLLIGLPAVLALVSATAFSTRNRSNGVIVSSGKEREYLLRVPSSYVGAPTPLVISMHGGAGWPALQEEMSGWSRLAEAEGFIVVYPAGIKYAGPRGWRVSRGPGLHKDVRFIADLIDVLSASYSIDPSRIFADGLSNGAGMAYVLSCALDDRIAAVGMVAACHTLPWSWCTSTRPVPMIAFHGTADPITPYHGGRSWVTPRKTLPDIAGWAESWAQRNQCQANPVESAAAPDVNRREYTDCAGGAAVVLYTIRGGGHSWPGGEPPPEWFVGLTTQQIDATTLTWEFFQEHSLDAGD